jgi:UPF0176 protein
MKQIVNVAAYQFTALDNLPELRRHLHQRCVGWGLMGTILLSPEGINLFVAGSREAVDLLLAELRARPELSDLAIKESFSDRQPFNRMLVRLKREIIAFGVEGIEPQRASSPKLAAQELKQWLDEGRDVTLLDTRNEYEVKLGTFRNARSIGIAHFRDFPEAVKRLPEELKERPMVIFCTGGIRCEKAGPLLERQGFHNILQLDGGILKYFEQCGDAHYDGECFVFDQRVALDPQLRETQTTQCFACQQPVTAEDQQSVKYVAGQSCPACYRDPAERLRRTLEQRHQAIRRVTDPLPGSVAYENRRPIKVPQRFAGASLMQFLCGCLPHVPPSEWQAVFAAGRMVDRQGPVSPERIVVAGESFCHVLPGTIEPDVNAAIEILYEDQAIIVVNKPAPLAVHPCGQFNRNTLTQIMAAAYKPERPRVAHRLDANTTGVVIMTRNRQMAGRLQPQFERREVDKTYLVRVHGRPDWNKFVCEAPISAEIGAAGVRAVDPAGLAARTEFRLVGRLDQETSLVEARPITGRTNQIRVHLWHLGLAVMGDPLYLPEGQVGHKQTLATTDPPLCLHAWQIAFTHPLTGELVTFSAPPPEWAAPHV